MLAAAAHVPKLLVVAAALIGNVKTVGEKIVPELVYDDTEKQKRHRGQVPGVFFHSAYGGFNPVADTTWHLVRADGGGRMPHVGDIDIDVESSWISGVFHRVHVRYLDNGAKQKKPIRSAVKLLTK
eukprot:1409381-Prymnesium_polylepis.1